MEDDSTREENLVKWVAPQLEWSGIEEDDRCKSLIIFGSDHIQDDDKGMKMM